MALYPLPSDAELDRIWGVEAPERDNPADADPVLRALRAMPRIHAAAAEAIIAALSSRLDKELDGDQKVVDGVVAYLDDACSDLRFLKGQE